MSWGKRVGSFLRFLPIIGVAIVFVVLAIIAQSYRDNFCMRDPMRSDAYAQQNAQEAAALLQSLTNRIKNVRENPTPVNRARLDDVVALAQTPGVFQSAMREAVWWNPLSWIYLGPKMARYTPQECGLLAEKIAEAQTLSKEFVTRYGGYEIVEPESTPPGMGPVIAAMPPEGS